MHNQTGFSYQDVDLGFAIFKLPSSVVPSGGYYPNEGQQDYYGGEEEQAGRGARSTSFFFLPYVLLKL